MAAFVARRIGGALALAVLISFGIFSLLHIAPGNTEQILLGTTPATPETIAALRAEYHLDKPFLTQYLIWARNAVHLDLGRSSSNGQAVTEAITQRLPVSLFLTVYAFVLIMPFGVALGILASLRPGSIVDRAAVSLSIAGTSIPPFVTAVWLLLIFAIYWKVFPAFGAGDGFGDRLLHLTLPALALMISSAALVTKVTRTAMVEVLRQDYITFARARGLRQRRVIVVHAFRNARVTVVTSANLLLAHLIVGSVLVEIAFSLPGLGRLLVDSVEAKDVVVVQGVALLFGAAVIMINLLSDLAHLAVDPRIRFGVAAK